MKKMVKEAKLLENPSNFEAWKTLGLTPKQIAIWENIGKKMGSDKAITDEGTRSAGEATEEKRKMNEQYNHPTSVADRKARGVA
jgi:hypothetical protein